VGTTTVDDRLLVLLFVLEFSDSEPAPAREPAREPGRRAGSYGPTRPAGGMPYVTTPVQGLT
jgi:hypothetical protein